jgi:hypothetical protein
MCGDPDEIESQPHFVAQVVAGGHNDRNLGTVRRYLRIGQGDFPAQVGQRKCSGKRRAAAEKSRRTDDGA